MEGFADDITLCVQKTCFKCVKKMKVLGVALTCDLKEMEENHNVSVLGRDK